MKVRVGYITSWRKAIFFSVVFAIVIFGLASTVSRSLLGAGLVSNVIAAGAFVLCVALFILVLSDRFGWYEGIGTAVFQDGNFSYNDKKRHINLAIKDITKLDIQPIDIGQGPNKTIAYRILIQTAKKKYYIESERAFHTPYHEVDVYNLYLALQERRK